MEDKEKLKKTSFVMILVLALVIAFTSTAMAAVTNQSGKDTEFNPSSTPKEVYNQSFADPAPHIDYFYLPGSPSDGTTKIHSNYSKNTDACAACHFTHSAEGPRLLQWNSVYKTCAACHDGSLGNYTYDVFDGKIGTSDKRTYGGLFGEDVSTVASANNINNGDSLSNHMPDGYMSLSAAPGAIANAGMTGEIFDCASCHTPHGQGGNARILSPDPGKMKINDIIAGNVSKYASDLTSKSGRYSDGTTNWIQGYPYNRTTAIIRTSDFKSGLTLGFDQVTDKLTVTGGTILSSEDYTINYTYGEVTPLIDIGNDNLVAVRVPGIFVAMKITDYMHDTEKVEYVAKYVDETKGGEVVDGASNPDEGINAYCGACHGMYNTQGNEADGSYDFVNEGDINHGSGQYGFEGLFRHQVGLKWVNQWTGKADYIKFAFPILKDSDGEVVTDSDDKPALDTTTKVFTCLGCHFAHGTDEKYWFDYVKEVNNINPDGTYSGSITGADEGLDTLAELSETYGSSALKRLPNMATCEDCHDKSSGNAKDEINGERYY